jgi:pimeloyl-ACP methyl ester carboxylesterase
MTQTALSINLNKIALIRNSRDTEYPSVTHHAKVCIDSGADGITVHPRPDQRHIRVSDCFDLAAMLDVEFNMEGNPFAAPMKSDRPGVTDYPGFIELVKEINIENSNLKTLFLRGELSNYILGEDFLDIKAAFPNGEIKTIKNVGHWLHAENPNEFYKLVDEFISEEI